MHCCCKTTQRGHTAARQSIRASVPCHLLAP